jgi:sugar/nucleoside kinase (ribokinase family)
VSDTKKVMTIGGATQDIFIHYHSPETMHLQTSYGKRSFLLFEEGHKIDISKLDYHTGGGATNAAVSFKNLGFDVTTFFKIGSDKVSEFIIQRLEAQDIDTRYVVYDTQRHTGTSFIIPSPSGDRVVLAARGTNAYLNLDEIPFHELVRCQQLYVTSLTGHSADLLLPITRHAREHHIAVAVNPGSSQLAVGNSILREALIFIDILILNSTEARMFMRTLVHTVERLKCFLYREIPSSNEQSTVPHLLQGPIMYKDISFDVREFFKEVLRYGPHTVVVTNGKEGVYVATKEAIYFHPSLPVDVISTIGAGDAFGSCFVASLLDGASIPEALVKGIINSSSVIGHFGAKTGLLNKEELTKQFEAIGIKGVQHFAS